ncbi:MAG: CPBP family intramembrane metalloprotease [Calditrichaeota bacterium]|nr:CPBP family intramembrane metalloprotease [Calditrichota bacterium]
MLSEKISSTKKQVFIFVIATYLFSWLLFTIGYFTELLPVILIGIWGPTISSISLTAYLYGKEGIAKLFSRFKRLRVKWYFWLALILLPAAIHLIGRSGWQLLYDGEINAFYRDPSTWLSAIIPSIIIAGLGEEFGWRGFALPRLQQHFSPVQASLILAFVHIFWHLPTYWLGQGIHNVPALFVVGFALPWTFIFNWIYNRSGGSMIFAVGFHAISNASLSIVRFMPLDSEVPITTDLITQISLPAELAGPYLSVIAVYTIVALLVIKFGKFNQVNTDIP